ncbi:MULTISPECIES: A24 family peptidase C-terminal domain-containing protein [unclassified Methanoculleus]|jgi:preflagellin peptidase FlaK|uniref:A24 family peptidase C-terminal domain-containing protein n=1 Tax=Methanoculleus palmolei TaxID=72612 RepID=A0ABD8AAH5_9EURY|nr:A24 family peptidase C-terminal domain-containing protein [Methanoculleus sp. UBA377]MDD2472371.1 A24 family peptidase C-terminal domain-containing protein [Methanoculleus sp.]WOX56038.1 A24 family peptidase C-terminal domain-containing protein [Methanoculleus palmolei]
MILPPAIGVPLLIAAVVIGITLIYASILDAKERRVPHRTWRPALAVAIPAAVWVYGLTILADWRIAAGYLILVAVFCGFFYLFQAVNLFGGADAYALIIITACIPFFPIEPYFGSPPLGFFPFTVLTNAVLINIATPIAILAKNLLQGNRAPLPCLFLGFPVDGKKIQNEFGFVMEDIEERDGRLMRRFVGFTESLGRILRGERRLYTKDLRLHPEDYREELALYRKAGRVWISYGIPFIIPITAGFLIALFMGDILFIIMKTLAGM